MCVSFFLTRHTDCCCSCPLTNLVANFRTLSTTTRHREREKKLQQQQQQRTAHTTKEDIMFIVNSQAITITNYVVEILQLRFALRTHISSLIVDDYMLSIWLLCESSVWGLLCFVFRVFDAENTKIFNYYSLYGSPSLDRSFHSYLCLASVLCVCTDFLHFFLSIFNSPEREKKRKKTTRNMKCAKTFCI